MTTQPKAIDDREAPASLDDADLLSHHAQRALDKRDRHYGQALDEILGAHARLCEAVRAQEQLAAGFKRQGEAEDDQGDWDRLMAIRLHVEAERDAAIARAEAAEKGCDIAGGMIDLLNARLEAAQAEAGRLREAWIAARHVVIAARACVAAIDQSGAYHGSAVGDIDALEAAVTAYDQRNHDSPGQSQGRGSGEVS